VAVILELKTTDAIFTYDSVRAGGMKAITEVGRLAPLNTDAHLVLLEELGRVIGAHLVGEIPSRVSVCVNHPWHELLEYRHPHWQGDVYDIASSVMLCILRWQINTKLVMSTLPPKHPPAPSLLAYSLGLDHWLTSKTIRRAPIPDYNIVESLLRLGYNPNGIYKGCSIWRYTVSYLHLLNEIEKRRGNLDYLARWIRLCQLLLEHGADPNVGCIRDYHDWWLEISRDATAASEAPCFNVPIGVEKSPYINCTVTTVFNKIFMRSFPLPGARALLSLLESKKQAVRDSSGSKQENRQWTYREKRRRRQPGGRGRGRDTRFQSSSG
jgi:hypothetical protein